MPTNSPYDTQQPAQPLALIPKSMALVDEYQWV